VRSVTTRSTSRHSILLLAACCVGGFRAGVGLAAERALDLSDSADVIRAEIRLNCSSDPAHPRISWMTGELFARRQGEADRRVFRVQGINTRACEQTNDPQRGPGYRSVTREAIFYLDPDTGEMLREWKNPWTGETLPVVHMFNDPVNMAQPRFARDESGKPVSWPGRIVGNFAIQERRSSFLRDSPLGGGYQAFVGGRYQAVEISTTIVPVDAWLGPKPRQPIPVVSAWTRISPWLPWMKMGDREGQTVLVATWQGAASIDELPDPLRGLLKGPDYALYATAPPLDDARPSVFSWDGIKRALDQAR